MSNPYQVVRDFEAAVAEYTGAPYVVAVSSCTAALTLAVAWFLREPRIRAAHAGDLLNVNSKWYDADHVYAERMLQIEIPRRTYVSVPMAIIHAGGRPTFRDEEWRGAYQLKPLPVWDCARVFTSGMYRDHGQWFSTNGLSVTYHPEITTMMCVSFQASKILGDTQGGAILHDSPEADRWLRKARFDGRTEGVAPKDDTFDMIAWHCYMSPDVAARLMLKFYSLPKHNDPLPNDEYPDLSQMEIFR